ncbi:hypothetical protein KCP76_07635 [Salmonella enterica subsp. enterica serovar Weltevreden]|nr:hypothetical protein KCP76_07635 [Salmonella enterica subsp. enterica serovar Weltevreden]
MAHAIEAEMGPWRWLHGEAVAGIVMAARASGVWGSSVLNVTRRIIAFTRTGRAASQWPAARSSRRTVAAHAAR